MRQLTGLLVLVVLTVTGLSACSSTSNSAGGGNVISAAGGEGVVASGGNGGFFYSTTYDATHFKILRSGSVDTTVDTSLADELTSAASITFGSEPLDVTSSMTVQVIASNPTTTPAYYMYVDDGTIYHWDGSAETAVTGIHVHDGATLTLGLNVCLYSFLSGTGLDTAYVVVGKDVLNEGVITAMTLSTGANETGGPGTRMPNGTDNDMGHVYLETSGAWVNNGTITLAGKDSYGGGIGGELYASAGSALINRGSINVSGGNGDFGGSSGRVIFLSGNGIWNSGSILCRGGTGNNGYGGVSSSVQFIALAYFAPIYNSAAIDVSGGGGSADSSICGGHGGGISFRTGGISPTNYAGGDIVNSGKLVANGGNCTAGWGGTAGDVGFETYGANIRNSGNIEMIGGKGTGGVGGLGGALSAETGTAVEPYHNQTIPAGSIQFSGSIQADGGAGDTGGGGRGVIFRHHGAPAAGDIVLYGYSNINLAGGIGKTFGGKGGQMKIQANNGYSNGFTGGQDAEGTIRNEADVNLAGGNGSTTNGGNGGIFFADTYQDAGGNPTELFSLANLGNITASGGQGVMAGGNGGTITMISDQNLQNAGALIARGGLASDVTGTGGSAGSAANALLATNNAISLAALDNISNTGTLDASGGDGAAGGGSSYYISAVSEYGMVVNNGNIFANGGNATTGTGGDAYNVNLEACVASGPYTTQNTGTVRVKGGTGAPAGSNATFYLDGVAQ